MGAGSRNSRRVATDLDEQRRMGYGDLREGVRRSGNGSWVGIPALGIRVGLLNTIEQRVRRAILGELAGLGDDILSNLSTLEATAPFPDGSLVEVNWEASLTVRDWQS